MTITRIGKAFAALRRQGYIARQNYLCCGTCAGAAIATDIKEKRLKPRGAVFYTKQDREREGDIYLSYGPVDIDGKRRVGEDRSLIGAEVCAALSANNIKWTWDGDPSQRIVVDRTTAEEMT